MSNKKKDLNSRLTSISSKNSTSNTKNIVKSSVNTKDNVKSKKNKYAKIYENNKKSIVKKTKIKKMDNTELLNKKSNKVINKNKNIKAKKTEIENIKLNLKTLEEKNDNIVLKKDVDKKQKNTENKKKSFKVTETLSNKRKNLTIKLGKIKLSKLKKILLIIIIVLFVVGFLIFFIKENPVKVLSVYKKYEIGDKISDKGKTWYVIENSDKTNNIVKLIMDKPLDLNQDGKINDKDKVAFDTKGNFELSYDDKNNIGFLLKNTYSFLLGFSGKVDSVSLLTSEQYIKIRKHLNLDYTWDKGNWLASKDIGIYWLNTSNNKKVYAVNINGSYRLENAAKKYYLRPVIIVHKTEIK